MVGGKTATIFDIQRFCVHDGPGIRTVVFFKGCPLRCIWCHNPESVGGNRELMYRASKCTGCGACADTCKHGVHTLQDGLHAVHFDRCIKCGECLKVCCYDALSLTGSEASVDDIMKEIKADLPYYGTDGGVTLSGGEPMLQADFALELARAIKASNIDLCIETCGYASSEAFRNLAPYVDTFLYDYKATDPAAHRKLTGASNELILQNLQLLNDLGKSIILRCPMIPGLNDSPEHLQGIARTAKAFPMIKRVELLPYHRMGEIKHAQMGTQSGCPDILQPTRETQRQWLEALKALDCTAVVI